MKILCHLMLCKWVHKIDVVVGYNNFDQPITTGLWQCRRCGELSKGRFLGTGPKEDEPKEKIGG